MATLVGGEIIENKLNEADADLVTLTQLEESLPNFGEHPADKTFLNYTFKPAIMQHLTD